LNLVLEIKPNCSGKSVIFAVPLPMNEKVIAFCGTEKINVTVSNKGKKINFVVKASRFGSKANGDRRIFRVPSDLKDTIVSLCGTDTVKVTLSKIKSS